MRKAKQGISVNATLNLKNMPAMIETNNSLYDLIMHNNQPYLAAAEIGVINIYGQDGVILKTIMGLSEDGRVFVTGKNKFDLLFYLDIETDKNPATKIYYMKVNGLVKETELKEFDGKMYVEDSNEL